MTNSEPPPMYLFLVRSEVLSLSAPSERVETMKGPFPGLLMTV